MTAAARRIAINAGGPYVSGLNAVVAGAVRAADELGWEMVGIRDGFEGILFRERYADGGIVSLKPSDADDLSRTENAFLGTSRINPFRVRTMQRYEEDMEGIEEVDRSNDLIALMKGEHIDGLISVVGRRAMSVSWKLDKKNGPKTICVPESVENDAAITALSFGFNTALNLAIELLDQLRVGARAARRIAVVEVLGEHAGWLALQSGIAACADVVLIPEIAYDLAKVSEQITKFHRRGRSPQLVVVAEGAHSTDRGRSPEKGSNGTEPLRRALSPGASTEGTSDGRRVIERSGAIAESVALEIQRRCDLETFPFVLSQILRGGRITPTDRQLGIAYGAAAVKGLHEGHSGELVVFRPEATYVPMVEALNSVRTVPPNSQFMLAARALGISLGD